MFSRFKGYILPMAITAILLGGIWIMFFSHTGSHSVGEPIVQVKLPKILSQSASQGQKIFEKNCSACHGKYAGGSDNGPPLVHGIYEPNHHSDQSFFRAAKIGVRAHHWPFGNMPPVKSVSREDVQQIISYVRTLQRENGIY